MDQIITVFVRKQLNLLLLERNENFTEFIKDITPANVYKLECIGQALSKLVITNIIYKGPEHFQIDLKHVDGLSLDHKLSSGDLIVCIRSKGKEQSIKGVIIAIDVSTLSIITNNQYENIQENESFTVAKTDSTLTYKRQTRALEFLEQKELYSSCCLQIAQILFDNNQNVVHNLITAKDPIPKNCLNNEGSLKYANENLVKDQRSAVEFALKQRYFAAIQGPPGTGKTTTLIEIILQLHRIGKKVLICAPTNVAVDNLVVRLGETELKPLRLGHLSRISADAIKYSLDSYLEKDDDIVILKDITKSIKDIELNIESNKSKYLFKETKALKKEYKKRFIRLTSDILRKCSVILCTLNSASPYDSQLQHVPKDYFDVLIVDEASQAMEASMWIAIPNAPKLILAGDINQLPPVVMCEEAIKGHLNISLMERAIKKLNDDCFITLTRQFRMNEKIMAWSNKKFYNNILEADNLVKNHLLKDLSHVKQKDHFTNEAVIYIDTCGCECEEYNTGIEFESKGNLGEVVIVDKIVTNLVKAGVTHKEIGVITPYALQVDFIHKSFMAKSLNVEVSTVDGFQGREKEVIVFSLVRSNQDRELGFVTDFRRLNVAVTRARRLLIVIADSETMEKDELILSLLKHIEENGLLQTAEEYLSNTIDSEIEQITNISQSNLRHKVKPKVKSLKQENNKKPKTSEMKDKKRFDDKIREVVPKLRNKGSSSDSIINTNINKYNIFEAIDGTELDEEAQKSEETFKLPDSDVSHNLNRKERPKKKQDDIENKSNEHKKMDDFDKIIDEFKKSNSICSFNGCKKSTNLIKLVCEFCKKWFCLEHGMQEIHGCGNAIRRKEQKAFKRRKLKTITKQDKEKFSQKLKNLEEARKPNKRT
ncbi:PREDICTED: DNA-binding protein SMUBP-2-like [Ceratosolen solmsi marchali]|uniref:DNA-binding protein SMUBP-2-like n=1 Tax=Ceratosolen solmsi marchali TaxID=326594 RepID=A0AAJ6YH82_9HYME|nr:PREDICTED: DNA-binding protein SMUBP-2-like [Ceratosolen solmsi marchali]